MKTLKIFLLFMLLPITSCSNDSESDLIEDDDPDVVITYNNQIRSIMSNNCTNCHSDPTQNGAPFPLTNYDQVLVRAENGQLLNAIKRQTGEPRAMPPSGRLSQSTIDLVERWIEEGFREN